VSDILHVHPLDDLRDHVTSGWPANRCWCNPNVEEQDGGGTLVVHNSMDRREEYEQGRKPS
jgi:hypothetical protein